MKSYTYDELKSLCISNTTKFVFETDVQSVIKNKEIEFIEELKMLSNPNGGLHSRNIMLYKLKQIRMAKVYNENTKPIERK